MGPKLKFQEGEKVLCFHGPLIYEAKCLKISGKDKIPKYYVHYAGWNKNWDEWVNETRMLKHNEANLQKQRDLIRQHEAQIKSKKGLKLPTVGGVKRKSEGARKEGEPEHLSNTPLREVEPSPSTASATTSSSAIKRKRPRSDATMESEEEYVSKVEVKIKIPDELKAILVEDLLSITVNHKLVLLPAKVTVKKILEDYVKAKSSAKATTPGKQRDAEEMVRGLNEYFNHCVTTQLLYQPEKHQSAQLLEKGGHENLAEVFGGIHLLRLFVKLGGYLAYTQLNESQMQHLVSCLHEFLRFLVKNAGTYFQKDAYISPAPDPKKKSA